MQEGEMNDLVHTACHGDHCLLANEKDSDGYTPLHWSSFNGHYDIVKLMLDRGSGYGRRDNGLD